MDPGEKLRSVAILALSVTAGMSLWFTANSVLPNMAREAGVPFADIAILASAVQAGFVIGALSISASGLADRFDPRLVFSCASITAAATNALLVVLPIGSFPTILSQAATGALLAGVYPVGMKIVVGWGLRDRGLLVGLVVGALTLGKSTPYLTAFAEGSDWRLAVLMTSGLAALGGIFVMACRLGPHHAIAARLDWRAMRIAWSDWRIRNAILGYLGHMWELFVMWAWIAAMAAGSYAMSMQEAEAEGFGKLTAFVAIALGGLACFPAGWLADRIGKAEVTIIAMTISGTSALLTAFSFGGPAAITFGFILLWGFSVVADSAQFSALVADFASPERTGSLLALQTALGFALTILTVQTAPWLAGHIGWPLVIAVTALGPIAGITAMLSLRRSRFPCGDRK